MYRDYPELRDSQLTHFLYEKEDWIRSLELDKTQFPEWILHTVTSRFNLDLPSRPISGETDGGSGKNISPAQVIRNICNLMH
jgi:hypothetical protein